MNIKTDALAAIAAMDDADKVFAADKGTFAAVCANKARMKAGAACIAYVRTLAQSEGGDASDGGAMAEAAENFRKGWEAAMADKYPAKAGGDVVSPDDLVWLLAQMRHSDFDHDFQKDADKCSRCKRRHAIEAKLKALAPSAVGPVDFVPYGQLSPDFPGSPRSDKKPAAPASGGDYVLLSDMQEVDGAAFGHGAGLFCTWDAVRTDPGRLQATLATRDGVWVPIESAPKSGDFLLGVWEGDWNNVRQRFRVYHATGHREGPSWAMRGSYRTDEGGAFEMVGWQPLPAAPKGEASGD